ncbi:hypothetical protein PUN28_009919 [Cardiocondyla obscurior]|uniref:Uncharacterized protein n=1 Tax=Cardiocondyla obscurior TaxID=286306 RepID=A0AAW2FLB0_9HYME
MNVLFTILERLCIKLTENVSCETEIKSLFNVKLICSYALNVSMVWKASCLGEATLSFFVAELLRIFAAAHRKDQGPEKCPVFSVQCVLKGSTFTSHILRGGGGLGKASCFSGATPDYVVTKLRCCASKSVSQKLFLFLLYPRRRDLN